MYPTIEVINRLYPPQGLENHFPVPVHFTLEELEMALSGRMVTRVIYLEDPQSACPSATRWMNSDITKYVPTTIR